MGKAVISAGRCMMSNRVVCVNSSLESKKKEIESVLGIPLTSVQCMLLKEDWHAFYKEPWKYRNSVVLAMIVQYLGE